MEIKVDKIIKSKRKTIALQINKEGHLIVRTPLYATKEEVINFIKRNTLWILKNKEKIEAKKRLIKKISFTSGEKLPFLGKYYNLEVLQDQDFLIFSKNNFYLGQSNCLKAKELFIKWYKNQAYSIIKERLDFYCNSTGLTYSSFKINSAKKRWGSCSFKNNLNFSWRLILTPIKCVDYVVVHELVHTIIKDHSKNFWKRLEAVLPDYKRERKFLKEIGPFITEIF